MTHATSIQLGAAMYPHMIGEVELTVISDGTFGIPPAFLASGESDEPVRAWLRAQSMPEDVVTSPLNVWLVRVPGGAGGERVMLIDTGAGALDTFGTGVGRLFGHLDRAGIDPLAITDLAMTHLHTDHIGGALMAAERGLFSESLRVHVARVELEFWGGDTTAMFATHRVGPEIGTGLTGAARTFIEAYGSRIAPFDDGAEIAPGVTAHLTPGHTPGHAGFRIESGGRSAMILGDAVNLSTFDNPEWEFFFDTEPEAGVRTRRALLGELCEHGELVTATHVSFPALGRVTTAPGGERFRFNPITWAH
ncbi:MAG: MBL fold metallo-hydrolase [Planctomycetota bacterium]